MKKLLILFIILYSFLNLSGCGSDPTQEDWTAERFYSEAKSALNKGDYTTAIKYYEMLETRYPFGKYAQQAQLDVIYAYYKYDEPESALVAADRFIKLYPRHKKVDYVYYMKGVVNFELTQGLLDRFLPLDRSQRDQGTATQSFLNFSKLVTRFPKSKYSPDARLRMIHLRNRLAQSELNVAAFYMKRGAYLAAANRAKTVIASYQGAKSMPKALIILAKSYKILGLKDLSNDALRVLKLNYPNSEGIAEVENLVVE
jgi:outer membrane protein assembly factor BamD